MNYVLITVALLFFVVIAAGITNHYQVQSGHNKYKNKQDHRVLRTTDDAFDALPDLPFEPRYIEIEDDTLGTMRVHYLDEGPADGEVILLLHGQATWSYSFRKMIPILTAAGYRVVAPDLIGFGRSDKPANWEDHSFEKHVEWLTATLDALDISKANGFLFDWGGYFALRIAAEKPELFSRVVLCTTTMPRARGIIGTIWISLWRRKVLLPEVFPISAMVDEMTHRDLDADTIAGLDAPYPDQSYKAGPRRFPLMIPATLLNKSTIPNREAWEKLADWDKPAVTLVSETLAKRGFNPKEFHEQLPGTAGQAHATYPDVGFFIIEDIPEQLAEKTLEFIRAN